MAETTASRLVNWALGVGSVVTGGLLLWIGSTTYELAKEQAVSSERLQTVQTQQLEQTRSVNAATNQLGTLSLRVQRVEDRIELQRDNDGSNGSANGSNGNGNGNGSNTR